MEYIIINLSVSSSTTCFKGVVHAMWLCVPVLLCISATYGRGLVDILRLDERDDYMSDVEVTDEGVACDSCCEVPEDDTCGGILNKLDEIKVVIGNICTGKELERFQRHFDNSVFRRRARGGRWLDRGM